MARRAIERDARDFDTTSLRRTFHGGRLMRDYSAHFFRWSFVRRFVKATDSILEIGCGPETPLVQILFHNMHPLAESYVGVDLNPLRESSEKRVTLHGGFNFVTDWKKLQREKPDGFDVVVHLEVIEHMRVDLGKKFLAAAFKLLKPGGVMLMSTPCYDGKRHAANHIHEYTVDELDAAVRRAGFVVERRFGTFMDVKHIGRAHPVAGNRGAEHDLLGATRVVREALADYYDSDALSCFFAPLYPDHARNNLWVCRKPETRRKS